MFIYFIKEEVDGGFVKIGQTKNVAARLANLQTGSARKLTVAHSFEVDDENANSVESDLHHLFRNHRLMGEWFKESPFMRDFIKTIQEKGYYANGLDLEAEYLSSDPFSELYNQCISKIKEIREYGDYRRIRDVVSDVEELTLYAKKGRLGKY